MMSWMHLLALAVVITTVGGTQLNSSQSEEPFKANPQIKAAAYNFAVDVHHPGSLSNFQCIYSQGYNVAFIQIYSPVNGGSIVLAGGQNIVNANNAGLGTEIYVTPSLTGKTAAKQFDEAYNAIKNYGIIVTKVWLQVTGPINWPSKVSTNVNFISAFFSRAKSYKVNVGIYTNWYDWQQITGSTTKFAKTAAGLWYWSAFGQGPKDESVASFDDFRSFGGWIGPSVKQFAVNESVCGLTLNRDVYPPGGKDTASVAIKLKDEHTGDILVGGFV